MEDSTGSHTNDPDSEFVALLTEHQAALLLYVTSLMPGESKIRDTVQQANVTIWNKRSDFQLGTNYKAWIFAIARYEVLNFRKHQARESRRFVFSQELEEVIAAELPKMSEDLERKQEALNDCLKTLKTSERAMILARYFEDTSLADYARSVGRPVGSIKVSLHRIRKKLSLCISSKIAIEEAQRS